MTLNATAKNKIPHKLTITLNTISRRDAINARAEMLYRLRELGYTLTSIQTELKKEDAK